MEEELIKSANQIREKYRALKRGRFILDEERQESFKPITEKLEMLVDANKNKEEQIVPVQYTPPTPRVSTPSRIPMIQARPTPDTLEFGKLAAKYLANYLLPKGKRAATDTTYGIRKDENSSNFHIGNEIVEIMNDDITVGGKTYTGTTGLWELLTLKSPKDYTERDLANYKEILVKTSAHKKGYAPNATISANKHEKYTKVIAPLFSKTGDGLKEVTGNKIDYVHWNDVNELVDRLRLLILSREAGNTGVHNEIQSIIEELQEEGVIN